MEENNLSLEELKPFIPEWLWELKKKVKETETKSSELLNQT